MSQPRTIGVDAGGTKLLVGVVDEALRVHYRVRREWPERERDAVLDALVGAIEEARANAPEATHVGIGIPSLVDERTGTSRSSVHLPLDEVPFREVMASRLEIEVAVDNDANLALLAEHRAGAAREATHAAMLTLGTGVGGALLLEGRLYRGAAGFAAELGHIVVQADGPFCFGDCPGRGCLEAMASGSALARDGLAAARHEPESALGRALAERGEVTGEAVTRAGKEGDPAARSVLTRAGQALGTGITSIVNALNPEVVVVGGGAMAAGELLLEPARAVLAERALRPARELASVVPARFGEEAGMLGAALLAMEARA